MPKVKEAPAEEVVAAYRLHDEIETNPQSRALFASDQPSLDTCQRRVVEDLQTEGCAVTTVAEMFSQETWERLRADAAGFTEEMAARYANGPERAVRKPGKPAKPLKAKFPMGRRFKKSPPTLASPWFQLGVSERMLDVVNSYLGMWSKLTYVDQWYTPPVGTSADRLGSMRWHRDYNDQHLVKVFVYLVDVDEETGPFEYIPGSTRGGPYANEWPWSPAGETYPPPDEFARRIPSSAVRTFTAAAGSMILCNTSGLHRGGYVTEKPRSVLVLNYVSPASLEALVDRNFEDDGSESDLPDVVRFAIS